LARSAAQPVWSLKAGVARRRGQPRRHEPVNAAPVGIDDLEAPALVFEGFAHLGQVWNWNNAKAAIVS